MKKVEHQGLGAMTKRYYVTIPGTMIFDGINLTVTRDEIVKKFTHRYLKMQRKGMVSLIGPQPNDDPFMDEEPVNILVSADCAVATVEEAYLFAELDMVEAVAEAREVEDSIDITLHLDETEVVALNSA